MYLEKIKSPTDLKRIAIDKLPQLSREIRKVLINKVSVCGGHLASNLGVVELTIAVHYVFDAPRDKIVFDVSHQTYVHKMLTGRSESFLLPDHYNDVSGYSNPTESEYDLFNIGHTSTSISLACGLVKARDLKNEHENVVAIIGDSALDGGQSFEGLNLAGELDSGLIVIVNDNHMSIPENHGELNNKLMELRNSNGLVSNNYFESLGFEYHFLKNGHDINALISLLRSVRGATHPVLLHICTTKGKGYSFAEADPEKWHWAHPFSIETGEFLTNVPKENYGTLVCNHLLLRMKKDQKIVVVTASTPLCIGFTSDKRVIAGKQYIDVGIAEQNAISMATGISKGGGKPVFATNSTFYQRAYDQIEQEMCITKCPVTMIVTHASVFGHTNGTHVGLLDMTLLGNIPNLVYLAPTNFEEYMAMLDWSIDQKNSPVAIRVPWTTVHHTTDHLDSDYSKEEYKIVEKGSKVAILALGSFYQLGESVARRLLSFAGIKPTLINPRFITGIDSETLKNLKKEHNLVVTIEDGILSGGFGSRIAQFYSLSRMRVMNCGFSMDIPDRYDANELMKKNRLTVDDIVSDIANIEKRQMQNCRGFKR